MVSGEFDQALAELTAGVDSLLSADVSSLEEASLVEALRGFEMQRRRLEAVEHRLVKQANDTHLPASCATRTVAGVLAQVLRIDVRDARLRENRALDCGPRSTLTGEGLAPVLPLVAAAVAAGAISAAQVDVIVEAMARIPDSAPAQAWPVVEGVLVAAAEHERPQLLRRTAHELLTRLDPDGVEEREKHRERERGFTLSPLPDGWSRPSGRFDPRLTAQLLAVLDALAKPRPAGDGTADPRSAEQRRHDGLAEAISWVLRSDQKPDGAGGHAPVSVLASTTIDELSKAAGVAAPPDAAGTAGSADPAGAAGAARAAGAAGTAVGAPAGVERPSLDLAAAVADSGLDLAGLLASTSSGLATLSHGQAISAATLLAWACEAEVVPVVFNSSGGVMSYGRTRRYATPGQRLALAARDRGCSFPGCERPSAWCEAHHIVGWIKGGPTDLDNLTLVCSYHHANFAHAGWRAVMRDGVPWWIPPAWEDPAQRPRRNTAHHLDKIEFRQPEAA